MLIMIFPPYSGGEPVLCDLTWEKAPVDLRCSNLDGCHLDNPILFSIHECQTPGSHNVTLALRDMRLFPAPNQWRTVRPVNRVRIAMGRFTGCNAAVNVIYWA